MRRRTTMGFISRDGEVDGRDVLFDELDSLSLLKR